MNVDEFDYELPQQRIAQRPCSPRDASRLLVLGGRGGRPAHARFAELPEWLRPGDLLVFNDTKVLPARLIGNKPSGGRVELLLVEPVATDGSGEIWHCLMQTSRKPAPGSPVELANGVRLELLDRDGEGWRVRLPSSGAELASLLDQVGRVPLPPYIRRDGDARWPADRECYQTVYACRPGAVAAPTAGLHFSAELLDRLSDGGVERTEITLHVGPGTFLPVRAERVEEHRMHAERYEFPVAAAEAIRRTRSRGGRVVAVGTTVVRTLEGSVTEDGSVSPGKGRSDLFIYPGYRFRVVDALITNFHLPRSTLLMLVCAFAGREEVLAAYREAIDEGYRFYSYGDAMLMHRAG